MNEKIFNLEVKHSLEALGYWVHKLADSPASWTKRSRVRFTPEKPCDMIAGIRGLCVLIEGKQIKKWEPFGLKNFRESQIEEMDDATKKGNQAYAFLNVRIKRKVTKRTNQPYENRLIIFEWKTFKSLWRLEDLSVEDLKELPHIRGSEGLYDLKDFVEYVEQNHQGLV